MNVLQTVKGLIRVASVENTELTNVLPLEYVGI